jgi:hypothetical protein
MDSDSARNLWLVSLDERLGLYPAVESSAGGVRTVAANLTALPRPGLPMAIKWLRPMAR